MKKSRIFGATSAFAILLSAIPLAAQTPWNQIALAGGAAKILAAECPPRFSIRLTATFPFGRPVPQTVDFQTLQTTLHAPGVTEQLSGRLGGPFFIGPFSTPQTAQFATLRGRNRPLPGLALGYRLSPRFELAAGVQRWQSDWSGGFPVVVLPAPHPPQEQPGPQTLTGTLEASASGLALDLGGTFSLPGRVVQAFVEAGVRGIFSGRSSSAVTLAGVVVPLETARGGSTFSPFGGAGLRVVFCKNGFVETRFSGEKMADGAFGGTGGLGLGWRF